MCAPHFNQAKLIKNTIEKAITEPISRADEHNSSVFVAGAVGKGRRPQTLQTLSLALTFLSPCCQWNYDELEYQV
jgi:hypothetical protein